MKQLAEKAFEFNEPVFFSFINIKKTFDKIQLKYGLKILEDHGTPVIPIILIQEIYSNNYARIRIEGKLEEMIPVNQGIRQGDSLSPFLLNSVMNELIKDLKNFQDYSMGDENVIIVCYADDAALVAENENGLQRLLHKFALSCEKFQLKISSKKTKTLTISREPVRCKLQLDNTIVEQVPSFNFLGIQITSSKIVSEEVRPQAIKASKISGCLNETIWSSKFLRTEAKVRIYKTAVRQILTYTAETRTDTAKTREILEICMMKSLGRIARKQGWTG